MLQWDPEKAKANLRKHGVSFEEAASLFSDPRTLIRTDNIHSINEARWIAVGLSTNDRVLAVVFTIRSGDAEEITRIISARTASQKERTAFAAATRQSD